MRHTLFLLSLLGSPLVIAAQQLATPSDWKWRLDTEATLVQGQDVPEGSWRFVTMPPGWHVTTGPAGLLYPASVEELAGNFTVEAEAFLFPGNSPEGYGVFLGGSGLEPGQASAYTAFLVRHDGQMSIVRHAGGKTVPVSAWSKHDAVVPYTGKGTAKNVITVAVAPTTVTVQINGVEVASMPRSSLEVDGRAGLRVGAGVNLHVGRFDVTRRLAPVPPPK